VKTYLEKNESPKQSQSTKDTSEEIEKEEKKSRTRSRTTRPRVLYQVDATDLKMADRTTRILRSIGILAAEIVLIFVVSYLLGDLAIYGVIVLFVVIVFLLPSPVALAPSKYKITKQGILFNGEKTFPLGKKYRLRVNQNRNFISIRDRKGEVLKLYTTESEKVMKILDKLIASETKK
jgi:hypothetical protein